MGQIWVWPGPNLEVTTVFVIFELGWTPVLFQIGRKQILGVGETKLGVAWAKFGGRHRVRRSRIRSTLVQIGRGQMCSHSRIRLDIDFGP